MPVLADARGWFTLEVPEGWDMNTEDSVTTLRSPRGGGVVYLSGARHVGGLQPSFGRADFLTRFLVSLGIDVEEEDIAASLGTACRVYSHTRVSEGVCWRYFSVSDDETALLISYSGEEDDAARDSGAVDTIVGSVRLYHSRTH
jgi:hypothetical protein